MTLTGCCGTNFADCFPLPLLVARASRVSENFQPQTKGPAPIPASAGTEVRARCFYDDLRELFSFVKFYEISASPRNLLRCPFPPSLQFVRALVVCSPIMPLVEVAFLIAR